MTPERWRHIERLYHDAVDRPESTRSAWLHEACGGDQELRQEVEGLLSHSDSEDSLAKSSLAVAAAPIDDRAPFLAAGQRVANFEIQSLLGVGGMGEVYRARDTRLKRVVAIKFLSPIHADEHARRRFQQEALTASSLNHPNIVTVFEAGDFDGRQYLVTELVEGGALSEWVSATRPPWQQILELMIGVAEGLASAHDAGILHRDVKPANILVVRNGYAKLADFGLAKLLDRSQEETQTRTLDIRTRPGLVVGTIPYMSPEQAIGGSVDLRSDLFSFGVVLYELLAGRRPFDADGDTDLERLRAIAHREAAPLSQLRRDLPGALAAIVDKTLKKNPAERYQTAHDLGSDLRQVAGQSDGTGRSPVGVGKVQPFTIWAAALAIVAAAVAVTRLPLATSRKLPTETTKLSVTLPADQGLNADGGGAPLAISPDGRRVVYVADNGPRTQLYVRAFDAFESRALVGTEGARYPFFSSDGQSVGFFAGGKLLRLSLGGGAPVPVCDVPVTGQGATWGPDGTIVYDPGPSGLMRVSADGGPPALLASSDPAMDRRDFRWPQWLPGGDVLLATIWSGDARSSSIAAFSFRTREWRVLTKGSQPQYVAPGYLTFHAEHVREGELQAVAFDANSLRVRGTPVPFLNGVFRSRSGGAAYFAISRSGTLLFAPGGVGRTLVRVDRNGRRTPVSNDRRGFRFPRLSPNDRYVAVTVDPRPSEIWVYDLERGSRMPLATGRHSILPVWSPDGRRIAYSTNADLHVLSADGSGAAERLLEREGQQYPHSWSRDGRLLFFQDTANPVNKSDMWVLPIGAAPRPVLATTARELHPDISPDTRWLAYTSDESGREEIYVRPFPDVDAGKWPISIEGGHSPMWSRDGRELYYMSGQNLMAVAIRTEDTQLVPGIPGVLFNGPFDTTQDDNYDVSSDGNHFIMIEAAPEATMRSLQVVLNWSVELGRLMDPKNTVE